MRKHGRTRIPGNVRNSGIRLPGKRIEKHGETRIPRSGKGRHERILIPGSGVEGGGGKG